jgi:trigger factor
MFQMSKKVKADKNVVEFEFSVSGEEFNAGIEKAYKKNVGQIAIPGFRKGKAPRQIIEKYYGSEIFFEDAVNIVLPDAYDKAIEEQNIEAVAQPEIDVKSISKEDGVVFTAKVTVKPEFELGL